MAESSTDDLIKTIISLMTNMNQGQQRPPWTSYTGIQNGAGNLNNALAGLILNTISAALPGPLGSLLGMATSGMLVGSSFKKSGVFNGALAQTLYQGDGTYAGAYLSNLLLSRNARIKHARNRADDDQALVFYRQYYKTFYQDELQVNRLVLSAKNNSWARLPLWISALVDPTNKALILRNIKAGVAGVRKFSTDLNYLSQLSVNRAEYATDVFSDIAYDIQMRRLGKVRLIQRNKLTREVLRDKEGNRLSSIRLMTLQDREDGYSGFTPVAATQYAAILGNQRNYFAGANDAKSLEDAGKRLTEDTKAGLKSIIALRDIFGQDIKSMVDMIQTASGRNIATMSSSQIQAISTGVADMVRYTGQAPVLAANYAQQISRFMAANGASGVQQLGRANLGVYAAMISGQGGFDTGLLDKEEYRGNVLNTFAAAQTSRGGQFAGLAYAKWKQMRLRLANGKPVDTSVLTFIAKVNLNGGGIQGALKVSNSRDWSDLNQYYGTKGFQLWMRSNGNAKMAITLNYDRHMLTVAINMQRARDMNGAKTDMQKQAVSNGVYFLLIIANALNLQLVKSGNWLELQNRLHSDPTLSLDVRRLFGDIGRKDKNGNYTLKAKFQQQQIKYLMDNPNASAWNYLEQFSTVIASDPSKLALLSEGRWSLLQALIKNDTKISLDDKLGFSNLLTNKRQQRSLSYLFNYAQNTGYIDQSIVKMAVLQRRAGEYSRVQSTIRKAFSGLLNDLAGTQAAFMRLFAEGLNWKLETFPGVKMSEEQFKTVQSLVGAGLFGTTDSTLINKKINALNSVFGSKTLTGSVMNAAYFGNMKNDQQFMKDLATVTDTTEIDTSTPLGKARLQQRQKAQSLARLRMKLKVLFLKLPQNLTKEQKQALMQKALSVVTLAENGSRLLPELLRLITSKEQVKQQLRQQILTGTPLEKASAQLQLSAVLKLLKTTLKIYSLIRGGDSANYSKETKRYLQLNKVTPQAQSRYVALKLKLVSLLAIKLSAQNSIESRKALVLTKLKKIADGSLTATDEQKQILNKLRSELILASNQFKTGAGVFGKTAESYISKARGLATKSVLFLRAGQMSELTGALRTLIAILLKIGGGK